jgi:hypothetical protein
MDIIVSGVIIKALPVQSGVSQRGNQWSRASYIIEHEGGQYPRRMVFDVKDAKIQEFALAPGQQVTLHLNVDTREFPENSGKWFNSISAWKVERQGMPMQQGYQQPMQQAYPQQPMQPQYQQPMAQPQYQQQVQAPFPPQQAPAPFTQQQPVQQPAQAQAQPLPFPPAQ